MNRRDLYAIHTPPCASPEHARARAERPPQPHRVCVIRLTGEFDAASIHVLREILDATCEEQATLDVTHVTFADSSFLHALLEARRRVVLAGPLPRHLDRLLKVSGITTVITGGPDVHDAHRWCEVKGGA